MPASPALAAETLCHVLIRMAPKPWTCKGRIREIHGRTVIGLMSKSGIEENRKSPRYGTDISVNIEGLVYGRKLYPLHSQISAHMTDISKGGMRLRTAKNTFLKGDKILVRLNSDETVSDVLLFLECVNYTELSSGEAACGCRFILYDNAGAEPVAVGNNPIHSHSAG